MRKIINIAISFIACYILNLELVWLGFVPAYLALSLLKIDKNFLWEIPLAAMVCDALIVAFSDDIGILIYILSIASAVMLSTISVKKFSILFPAIIISVITKNIYSAAVLWAGVWYGFRIAFVYFTTKLHSLQEYKS